MAGFIQKFKEMWNPPDDEYDYDDYDEREEQQDDNNAAAAAPRTHERRPETPEYDKVPRNIEKRDDSNKVVNIHATAQLQVVVFRPEHFGEETCSVADELLKMHTVVLNLENTQKDVSRRIIDFLSGVAYANGGKIKRVATNTFIITPYNVDLMGEDVMDELENTGLYF